ncbi:MAG: Ig-like domain-containing protein [Verrucomicrobia bacterium]|nr:Ig-like domain-containing protein [Verrucomicrobiota bacterium]
MHLSRKTRIAARHRVLVLTCLTCWDAVAANLISDPGFQAGTSGTSYVAGSTSLPGWSVDTTPAGGVQLYPASTFGASQSGNTLVLQLTGGSTYSYGGGVSQTLTTTSGQTYAVSMDVASRSTASGSCSGNFSFGGQNHTITASSHTFATLTWTVTASSGNTVIDLTANSGANPQLLIDNVSVTPSVSVTPPEPIVWSPATTVAGDSDVATNGVLLYAEHWGGSDGTINGVPFTAAGVYVTKSDGSGSTQTVAWTQGSLSTTYYNLLSGNWYNAGNATVSLNNLTFGHLYQVQMWSMDKRYTTGQTETYAGSPAVSPSIGTGQYAIGTFTATATAQAIGVTGEGVINAVVVRDISNITPGPVDAAASTIVASPASIPPDGSTTVIVTLKDAAGNRIPGKTVTLASGRGAVDTLSAASGPTNSAGVVTFGMTSGTEGSAILSATDTTDDNLVLAQTATVNVQALPSHAPQTSPDPIVFDQTATSDNLVVLMAAASEYSEGLNLLYAGASVYPKHFWFNNFNSANPFMKWNVALATGAPYHVYAKLSSGANVPLKLSVVGTANVLSFTTRAIGWDKLDAGIINIPSGTSRLVLQRDTTATDNIAIVALELIRESDRAAYEQRVAAFRADTTWLSQSQYGLMTQFGPWGYPPSGPRKSLEDFANGFDVPGFVNTVNKTGARYVIWSMTWWEYRMLAPIQALDDVVGNGNRTSTRDVVGELAAALHQAGIRFILYYHTGQDSHLGYNSTDWWSAQQWPDSLFTDRASGDRSRFFNNFISVISEIGTRYGTLLDGFFFDDGMVYYPAPFERLGQAAKVGNPNRLISYNEWIAASFTDFQEVIFGEADTGGARFGSVPAGGNGIYTDGPHKGLLQHGMFTMEQDWGVHSQNQAITTQINAAQAIGWVQSASTRNVPLSFNMMFWEDQTYSQASMDVLVAVKSAMTPAPANLIIGGQQFNAGNVTPSSITAMSGDLLETRLASVTGEIANTNLRNGTTGTAHENSTQNPASAGMTALTYNLDLTTSPSGYDIREIRLFSGWTDGRTGQSYRIEYALAGSPTTFTVLGTVSVPLTTTGSLLTRTFDLTGSTLLTGAAALRFVMIDNGLAGSGTVFREIDVLGTATSGNPPDYNAWAANFHGVDLTDPAADADGDGMTNQQEYAFGLDPTSGSSVSPFTVPLDKSNGTFTYQRRPNILTHLTCAIWTSTDLTTWSVDTTAIQHPDTPAGDLQTVVVTITPTLLSSPKLFVQVRAN